MKKWLFPVASAILFALLMICIFVIGVGGNGDGSGFIGAIISLILILICLLLVPPFVGFVYAKFFLKNQKFCFLFTLYQSFMITIPYLILFWEDNETLLYAAMILVWCELWSLLGLVRFGRRSREGNHT